MNREEIDQGILLNLKKVKGIIEAKPLLDGDREEILSIEKRAEERSLMGLGKVVNTGVYEIFNYDYIYIALTSMDFDWGPHPSLVLKKGQEVVGEQVRDKQVKEKLREQENTWFMVEDFVIYKDKMTFPQDLVKKTCRFETPSLRANWCISEEGQLKFYSLIYAYPVTPGDLFLKKKYFNGISEKGLGTILVGVRY